MGTDQDRPRGTAGPQSIGRIVSRLMARSGYDREQGTDQLRAAWDAAVPPALAGHSRPGLVRRGVLEVFVSHSAIVQELNFLKPSLLACLAERLPAVGITDIRCRLSDAATQS
jgi:predicted nucleic acid-binding Zn ribbon protein